MANYSKDKVQSCSFTDGMILLQHNFTQLLPHTKIAEGIKNLTFKECNLCNCDVPADAKVIDCLHVHMSRCSHLHDDLPYTCKDECEHMVSKEDIVVDGEVVDTIYTYEDKRVD